MVTGENGAGKTSLLEAIAYASLARSFRGSPKEALVRNGTGGAIVRLEVERAGRTVLLEVAIRPHQRDRMLVNRQAVPRAASLLDALRVSVFTPDDLTLVKGAPQGRRDYLDDALAAVQPRYLSVCQEVERVLRQRATLLRQAAGRLSPPVAMSLDVWDAKLAAAGDELTAGRRALVERLEPAAARAFGRLTGLDESLSLSYQGSCAGSLADALAGARDEDLRRAMTTVGPHRDDLSANVGGLDARTRLSQGRQRAVTLALRLAAHELVTDSTGSAPVLLLDDAFSELDPATSRALLAELPDGQALLTTASAPPDTAVVERALRVSAGNVLA